MGNKFLIGLAVGLALGLVGDFLFQQLTWLPPAGEHYYFRMGDSQVPIVNLTAEGLLVVNVPAIMKEWQKEKPAKSSGK